MSKKNRKERRFVNLIVILSLGVSIFLGASSITYALTSQGKPDVIVQIDKDGNISQSGDMYEDALWYPGFLKSGLIRLQNNFKRIKVTDLGLEVEINNINKDGPIYDSFVKNMILTISKGKLLVLDHILVESKSFSELLSGGDNDDSGLKLDGTRQFFVEKGDSVDLKYDLYMDKASGNELMNLTANVAFIMNLNEIPKPSDEKDNNDNDDKDKDKKESNLTEEPLDVILGVEGHWAHDCIIALIDHDILDPDSVSRIRPDDYITRAEAAVLIGRALKLEESEETSTGYVDNVPTWARGYVISTTKAKVFKGYPGNIFKSYGNITREEMTAVLIRAFREDSISDKAMGFIDEDTIAEWSRGNVAKSVEDGIVTGYTDNSFRPRAYMTRAEAFTIVCRLLGYHELHKKQL